MDQDHSVHPLLYSFRFAHHGRHSSYHHLLDYVPAAYKSVTIPTSFSLFHKSPRMVRYWLKLNEYRLLPAFVRGRQRCIHYLYPENTLFLGHRWATNSHLVVTWHQPLAYLEGLPPSSRTHAISIFKRSSAVIFLSAESRRQHMSLLGNAKSHVIKHGVDTEFFTYRSPRDSGTSLTIITVGNWLRDHQCWAKCVEALLEKRPDLNFKVLCNAANRASYERYLTRPTARVSFVSGLEDEELRKLYQEADIAFLPLHESTANNALLECMASGVPCVVTDLPSSREYAGGAAVLIDNAEVQDAVNAMMRLVQSVKLRTEIAIAARAKAEREMGWPVIARKHCEIYEGLDQHKKSGCHSG